MKRILLLTLALSAAAAATAQNSSCYFIESAPQRTLLNAALAPARGYFQIPGLGLSSAYGGDLSLDRILYPRNGGLVLLFDEAVSSTDALAPLRQGPNTGGVEARVSLVSMGLFGRDHRRFWSVDVAVRSSLQYNLPYEAFDLIKRGRSTSVRDAGMEGEAWLETGFLYSRPIARHLFLGVRTKFLMGWMRSRLRIDRFDVSLGETEWTAQARGSMLVAARGFRMGTRSDGEHTVYDFDRAHYRFGGPAGYGAAFDVGLAWEPTPDVELSLACNDLGFIAWGRSAALYGTVDRTLRFDGVRIGADSEPQVDFDLDDLLFEPDRPQAVRRMLHASILAGVAYRTPGRRLGIGLLYTLRTRTYRTLHEAMLSVNYSPWRWLTLTADYEGGTYGHTMGLALNLSPGWINLMLASDFIAADHTPQFLPVHQRRMSWTLGLSIPLGRTSWRNDPYAPRPARRP